LSTVLDGLGQLHPLLRKPGEAAHSGSGSGVVNAAASAYRPAPGANCPFGFQRVQHRIDDAFAGGNHGIGTDADGLHDLVAYISLRSSRLRMSNSGMPFIKYGFEARGFMGSDDTSNCKVLQARAGTSRS